MVFGTAPQVMEPCNSGLLCISPRSLRVVLLHFLQHPAKQKLSIFNLFLSAPSQPPAFAITQKIYWSFWGYQSMKNLFFELKETFFFPFQITQNWFGSTASTLESMKNKERRPSPVWNQKRGIFTFPLFLFPFLQRQYFFFF